MKGTTTERGLGWEHRKQRQRLIDAHVDGTPCPYCNEPMYLTQQLDADHSVARSHGGTVADRLAHATCNRKAGSRMAHAARVTACPHHRACGSFHSMAW